MDPNTHLVQHYILTSHPKALAVFEFIKLHSIACSIHLNRTRFWLDPTTPLYTQFALCFADSCPPVDSGLDLATGYKLQS